jgi:hypothetical protein
MFCRGRGMLISGPAKAAEEPGRGLEHDSCLTPSLTSQIWPVDASQMIFKGVRLKHDGGYSVYLTRYRRNDRDEGAQGLGKRTVRQLW